MPTGFFDTEFHGPWQDYSGDYAANGGDCVIALRSINDAGNEEFEYVTARREGESVAYTHGLVDMVDYLDTPPGLKKLDEIFREDGYGCFDDFVLDGEDRSCGLVYDKNGDLDRVNSPNYIVDMRLTAAHIAMHTARHAGPAAILREPQEAAKWISIRTENEIPAERVLQLMEE